MPEFDDSPLGNLLRQKQAEHERQMAEIRKLLGQFGQFNVPVSNVESKQAPKPMTLDQKMRRLGEIERELKIIKGVIPTPKGYKTTPGKVKELLAEKKRLYESN